MPLKMFPKTTMYDEISPSAFTIDTVKPRANLDMIKDYQHIPHNILQNYSVTVDLENRVLEDYRKYNENLERLEKARVIRKNRKAPGLQDTILMPTKAVQSKQSPVKEKKLDYSEFDSLNQIPAAKSDTKSDLLILSQVMSSASISESPRPSLLNAMPNSNQSRLIINQGEIKSPVQKATLLENVRFLAEMGFTEEQSTLALLKTGNDRDRALEQLLNM